MDVMHRGILFTAPKKLPQSLKDFKLYFTHVLNISNIFEYKNTNLWWYEYEYDLIQ